MQPDKFMRSTALGVSWNHIIMYCGFQWGVLFGFLGLGFWVGWFVSKLVLVQKALFMCALLTGVEFKLLCLLVAIFGWKWL